MVNIKPLMFSKLTREHAIKLYQTDWADRETMVKQLFIFLEIDGYNYAERASYNLLKDLAQYEVIVSNYHDRERRHYQDTALAPECVAKTYDLMFGYLDETIKRIVAVKYEIETWDDPMGNVETSCTVYDETEAWDEYNTSVTDGYLTRLLKIDTVTEETIDFDPEVIAANF